MEQNVEQQGLEHLAQIEEALDEIAENTPTKGRAFMYGVLQGAGAIIGSVIMLAILGYVLTLFGLLPGFGAIGHYLQDAVAKVHDHF